MIRMGINVAIGADGAACSNRLDIFSEMRLAALIQKIPHGVASLSPEAVMNMATLAGARALGENGGKVEAGANADFVVYAKDQLALTTGGNILSSIVYAATPQVIAEVWIGGEQVVNAGEVVGWSTAETVRGVKKSIARIKGKLL
jgi:5-methylthioadenosine/S-adenosylhomocysteine deaminase